MGKGTDKLYITHSEWSSEDAYGASKGSNASKSSVPGANFRRLPFKVCALSLQPFRNPVCTSQGVIFDHENILEWLKKHGTDPIDGESMKSADLIKLNFAKNDDGEYVDPVTYKVLTDNTHIVALRNTGNVFAWDTVERLNVKGKNWKDLVTDDDFTRKDIITLQDPQNLASRDLNSFKYMKDGTSTLTEKQEEERASGVNANALGSASKIVKAKEAVAKARTDREKAAAAKAAGTSSALSKNGTSASKAAQVKKPAWNSSMFTTGQAAASFTSTGVTVHTSAERATMTDEEYMLKPKRVKQKGYARIHTNHGDLNIELLPEWAPKAVWNFVQLSKNGYYDNTTFHRNIKNFMLQGGDPTGTGRGGRSIWGSTFMDEFEGPNKHNARGIISMANKGKNTNSSQFFITYRQAQHLDLKHTIFARVVGGMDTLDRLEAVKTDEKDHPLEDISILDISVFVDPFEDFMKQRNENEKKETEAEQIRQEGGTEDDKTTWTGKRIRQDGTVDQGDGEVGVGKYLKEAVSKGPAQEDEIIEEVEWEPEEPVRKKVKSSGGFGNFDSW